MPKDAKSRDPPPDLHKVISYCEAGFKGCLFWKSAGGQFSDIAKAIEELEGKSNQQGFTLGLIKHKDEEATACCDQEGYVTGMIFVGDGNDLGWIQEGHWDKINTLEFAEPGLHDIATNSLWLIKFS